MLPENRKVMRKMIQQHEGLRLKPYQCTAGRWTIGYGHNLEAHGKSNIESITLDEAEKFLDEDISSAENQCRTRIPDFDNLTDVRKAVLIDMCFNLGINGLLGFKKTLTLISQNRFTSAAVEMLDSKWAGQVKSRSSRLSHMMAHNAWPKDI